MGDKIANIAGTIVVLAIIATLVANGSNTATDVQALGSAFGNSIVAAKGGAGYSTAG